jgi:hypothetical protein
LFVEENIIGGENKRQLANYVPAVITSAAFEEYFQSPQTPLVQRLQQVESLRRRTMRSSFQENHRSEFADMLDRVAAAVETRNRLFDSIEKKSVSPAEKTQMLLRLIETGSLTEPRLTAKARQMVLSYLGKPGFLTGYVAQTAQPGTEPDQEAAVADLVRILEQAGIAPETAMKSIAA